LELFDVAEPSHNPDPIYSPYKRIADAQHDLMIQAMDGRIRGHIAIRDDLFSHARIARVIIHAPSQPFAEYGA
jgi:hypothetical protein